MLMINFKNYINLQDHLEIELSIAQLHYDSSTFTTSLLTTSESFYYGLFNFYQIVSIAASSTTYSITSYHRLRPLQLLPNCFDRINFDYIFEYIDYGLFNFYQIVSIASTSSAYSNTSSSTIASRLHIRIHRLRSSTFTKLFRLH